MQCYAYGGYSMKRAYKFRTSLWVDGSRPVYVGLGLCYAYILYHVGRFRGWF